jgi:electron transfer flavoprotein alpha subunit
MIVTLIPDRSQELDTATAETLTVARRLALALDTGLTAVLAGGIDDESCRNLAQKLPAYGVSQVYLLQHEYLAGYAPEAWARAASHLLSQLQPTAVLAPGTDDGNELLARVAAHLDQPLATNCLEVQPGDCYRVTRARWGGSLLEEALLTGDPHLLTIAPHTTTAESVATPPPLVVTEVQPALDGRDHRVRLTQQIAAERSGVSLSEARLVVGGGRGVGAAAGFAPLEALAELLGGAVGASRVATNNGWRSHADQIGQTGTRIAPDLYIACGISGAIQHIVGCRGAKRILVINKDPEAAIIAKADYAVIGDLHEIVPAMIAEIQKRT